MRVLFLLVFFTLTSVFTASNLELFYVRATKADGTTYLSGSYSTSNKAQEQASRPLPLGVVSLEVVLLPATEALPF